jgi:hypothetical protein
MRCLRNALPRKRFEEKERKNCLREKLPGLMLSCWATMAATWLIALVRTTTHDLLTTAQANAALAMDAIQERSTAALLLMSNIAGEALHEEPTAAQGAIVNAWRAQPDSEDLILSAFNVSVRGNHLFQE